MRAFNIFLLLTFLCLLTVDAHGASRRLRAQHHKTKHQTSEQEAFTLAAGKTVHDMVVPQVNGVWDARRVIKQTKAEHKKANQWADRDYNNKRGQAIQQHKADVKPLNQAKQDAINAVRAKSAQDRANGVPRNQRDRNAHKTVVKAGDAVRNQNRQHNNNLKNMQTTYHREKQERDSNAKAKVLAASNASLLSKMIYRSDGTTRWSRKKK